MADDNNDKPSSWEKAGKGVGKAFSSAGPVVIALALGGLGIYLIYQWVMEGFFGKARAFENALQTALDDYAKKMISYNEVTDGNLTEGQLSSEQSELHGIETLGNQLANAYGTFDSLIQFAMVAIGLVIAGKFVDSVFTKYRRGGYIKTHPQDPPAPNCMQSLYGQVMMIDMMIADQMIALGNTVGGTNLVNTMQAHYNSTIRPQMENQITSIQTEIASGLLVGTQLFVAQQTLAAMSYDIMAMPTLLAFPLVILP